MRLARTGQSNRLNIAVVGSGISGLSAAWLLSQRHDVTIYEADCRIGGHSHTVDTFTGPVDTGFIVYNEATYPNLTALFSHLGVPTKPTDMSFAVSLDGGRLEYAGTNLAGLFAQKRNIVSPRFWSMLRDIVRFYREAPRDVAAMDGLSLSAYLDLKRYGAAFREDHLYPMAAAIWSTPAAEMGNYPAEAFVRFCENHGLLKLTNRPIWRTVDGGSRVYVKRLTENFENRILINSAVRVIRRFPGGVEIESSDSKIRRFDRVVIATHADQALSMLAMPTARERRLLGAFGYSRNQAVLHLDASLMPMRRSIWASWNYMTLNNGADGQGAGLSVTYWMNRLQGISDETPLFLTLNPASEPDDSLVIHRDIYTHPIFDLAAIEAQQQLWSLQGQYNTWFCGAYFGAGFHEDGLQSGLAVAEALGGAQRPWSVADESGRISLDLNHATLPVLEYAS